MDILVIDRDSLTNQLLTTKLAAKGHTVMAEPNKNTAFDMIKEKGFDVIMVDPAPLSEARPVVVGIWKSIRSKVQPYMLLLSKNEASTEDAILSGLNDILNKPLSSQDIITKIENAERLLSISHWLAREDNVHSAGGMIGKAAFHQLFLSATDRAFRYGEKSLIVFVNIVNHEAVSAAMTAEDYEAFIKKVTQQMTYMRRQSDVVGRLSGHDFGILLQRPQYESEPIDAINRFSEVLDKFLRGLDTLPVMPQLHLRLIEIPQGALQAQRFAPLDAAMDVAGG
jgi:PleD family two-component response regulator